MRFWLEGVLKLQGRSAAEQKRKFREKIVLPLARPTNFTTLHLLGGMSAEDPRGTKVAEVIWRYVDGSFKRSALLYGVHMREWWAARYEEPATVSDAHSKAVWRGTHPDAMESGKRLRLYLTSLANPDTNKPVKAIEFVSAMANPNLFLVGVTLDGLPPGARDGNFRDLDEGRGGLTGTQFITALDAATGTPISGARVKVHDQEHVGTPDFAEYDREGVTAANGIAAVQQSQDGLDGLVIRVEADHYAPVRKEINLKKGDLLPPNLEIRLKGGLTIGGIVQDPDGQPLASVNVMVNRFSEGDQDEEERKSVQEFNSHVITTDPEGRWSFAGVPLKVVPNLVISAKHPDYVASSLILVGDNAALLTQLTNRTHVIKLAGGHEVTGIVLGPDDKPFPGAKVKAGQRWDSEAQREATSGTDGRFRLRNVRGELQSVTATADGYAPASKAVTPGTTAIELTLKLNKGASLKGVVLDPEGQPISGARLVYDPSGRDFDASRKDNLEWGEDTDEQGRFEWKTAPGGESEFSIYKDGYGEKHGLKLKAGEEDNIVRLSRRRKVLGVVGDVQTGQPVAKFFVWPGQGDEIGFNSSSGPDRREFSDAEGHFTIEIGDEQQNVIQVGADDYLPQFVRLPPPQGDYLTVTVLLEANPAAEGLVVDAAGHPVPDAQVGMTGQDHRTSLTMGRGRLLPIGNGGNVTRSDGQGHFKPLYVSGAKLLVGLTEAGYGEVSWAEFQQTKTVVLQPYGRVEGTLFIRGKPAEGQGVHLNITPPGEPTMIVTAWQAFDTDTDKDGKFAFNQVPPGVRSVIRLIKTASGETTYSHHTNIMVLPGQTTTVNLGKVGALITGRLNSALAIAGQAGVSLTGVLKTPELRPPGGFHSQAEFNAWSRLPETIAVRRLEQSYTVILQPDGSFDVDGVAPGEYQLNFNATKPKPEGKPWERIPLGSLTQPVMVGEEAANALVPMDLGELTLTPSAGTGK